MPSSDHTNALGKNLRLLSIQKALVTVYFHLPVVVLFWQDLGLTMLEIMLLQSIFSIAMVLLEFPSGLFADMFGRKLTLTLAALSNLIGIVLYCFAEGFYSLLAAELFIAGFIAMQSGADSAFLFDWLKSDNREDEFPRIFGNLIFYSTLVAGAAQIFGGFIAAVDLRFTIYACVPFVFVAFVAATQLEEPPNHANSTNDTARFTTDLQEQLKSVYFSIKRDDILLWVLVYAGIIFSFNLAGLWLYQPYFDVAGIDIIYFGIVFASFQVVSAYAGKYYYVVKARFQTSTILLALILLTCGASILLGYFVFLFSFTLIYLHQVVRGFYKISFNDIVNQRVDSRVRASVLSVQSLGGRLLGALLMPVLGWYADVYTIEATFVVIGVTGLICGIPVWLVLHGKLGTDPEADAF